MYCGDIEQLGGIKKTFKRSVKALKASISSKNTKSPGVRFAALFDPLNYIAPKAYRKITSFVPDKANKLLSPVNKKLHEVDPVTRTLRKKVPIFKKVTDFTGAKPASAFGLIYGGAAAASAYGAAGGAGAAGGGAAGGGGAAAGGGGALWSEAQKRAKAAAKKVATDQLKKAVFNDPTATGGEPSALPDEELPEVVVTPRDYTLYVVGGAAALLLLAKMKRRHHRR